MSYTSATKFQSALLAAFVMTLAWTGIIHAEATAGDLIKCSDFSSVYYLADDGTRNVFPDEGTYFSWYEDFDDVKEVSCDDMSDLPIGDLVEYQAGTQLVTTPSINQVYAVEPGGILREIADEDMAMTLYGEDWASRVRDVSDTFFTHYDVAEPLIDGELPDGMFIEDEDGNLYRMADGIAVEIDDVISETKEAMFAEHAVEMNEMQEALDALGVEFNIQVFAEEMMDLFATKMVSWMQTVDSDDQLNDLHVSLSELDNKFSADLEERIAAAADDVDGDGLKDFWETYITPYDNSGEEAYWDDAFHEWDEMEYDVYYNEYWEDFEGEHAYEDWHEDWKDWEETSGEAGYEDWYQDSYDDHGNVIDYYYDLNGDGIEDSMEEVKMYYDDMGKDPDSIIDIGDLPDGVTHSSDTHM